MAGKVSRSSRGLAIAAAILIAATTLIFLWSGERARQADIQGVLDRMDADVAAARAAAVRAGGSAAQAAEAARAARNAVPGSS